jgi:hypothetical protein
MLSSDWFFPISKLRDAFENGYRGTFLAGPVGTVTTLPANLGGDSKWWPALKASIGVSNAAFFELLHAKAHFLMLPKTIVTALKENEKARLTEDVPPDDVGADTVFTSSPRSAWMRIPTASDTVVKAANGLDRNNVLNLGRYDILARIYHEMTHAWLWLHADYDNEFQTLWSDGVVAYLHAKGVDGTDLGNQADMAFSEAAAYYVRGRIYRWCAAIDDLAALTANKSSQSKEEMKSQVQEIITRYDEYTAPTPQVAINRGGVTVLVAIESPDLSPALRDAIDKKVLDGLPLTQPFDQTPLAGLSNALAGN